MQLLDTLEVIDLEAAPPSLVWSIAETATALSRHPETIRRHIRRGALPSVRIGRRVMVPIRALHRLLDASAGVPPGPGTEDRARVE